MSFSVLATARNTLKDAGYDMKDVPKGKIGNAYITCFMAAPVVIGLIVTISKIFSRQYQFAALSSAATATFAFQAFVIKKFMRHMEHSDCEIVNHLSIIEVYNKIYSHLAEDNKDLNIINIQVADENILLRNSNENLHEKNERISSLNLDLLIEKATLEIEIDHMNEENSSQEYGQSDSLSNEESVQKSLDILNSI